MKRFSWFFLLALSWPITATSFEGWRLSTHAGAQHSFTLDAPHETLTLGYLDWVASGKVSSLDAEASWRLQGDQVAKSSRLQILSASLGKSHGAFQARIGWQKIAWGETFGFYIADLVNPRDYTNPWLNDIDWMRLAVPAVQLKWLGEALSLEAVMTPIPRRALLPTQEAFRLAQDSVIPLDGYGKYPGEHTLKAMEAGLRVGYLSPWGSDFSLIGYRHWNRNILYELAPNQSGFYLKPLQRRTTTLGLCLSHAFEAFVLRLDSVYHLKQPWASATYGQSSLQAVWQTVIGGDYTFESGSSIALQAHDDRWSYGSRQAVSFRLASRQKAHGVHGELFGYFGTGKNRDRWLQPRLTWNIDAVWQLKIDLNFLDGDGNMWQPQTGLIAHRDQSALLWLSAKV